MNLEEAFLRDILENPDDVSRRLIYADWLEEQGDPTSLAKAECLRLESALASITRRDLHWDQVKARLREVRAGVDACWRAALARVLIELCPFTDKFRCPKQWQKLQATEDPAVRFCQVCQKSVYYCYTIEQAREHARSYHRIAVDSGIDRKSGDVCHPRPRITPGVPLAPPPLQLIPLPWMTFLEDHRPRQRTPSSASQSDEDSSEAPQKRKLPKRPRRRRWFVEEEEEQGRKRTH